MSDSLGVFTLNRSSISSDGPWTQISGSPFSSSTLQANDSTNPSPTLWYQLLQTTTNGVVVPYNVGKLTTQQPLGPIGSGNVNVPTKIRSFTNHLHVLPSYEFSTKLWLWENSLSFISVSDWQYFFKPTCEVIDDRMIIADFNSNKTLNRVTELVLSPDNSTLTLASDVTFGSVAVPPSSCVLNGNVFVVALENLTTDGPQTGHINVAYRLPGPIWKTARLPFSIVGTSLPFVNSSAVAFNGFVYVFFTHDGSQAVRLLKLNLDGTNTVQIASNQTGFITTDGGNPLPIDPSQEAPSITAVPDSFNNRIILCYQNWFAVGGVGGNFSRYSIVAVDTADSATFLAQTDWYDYHSSFASPALWPGLSGIQFSTARKDPQGNLSLRGAMFSKLSYATGQIDPPSFTPTPTTKGVFSFSEDGWYLIPDANVNFYLRHL